jgi:hypothetical protein
VIDLRAWQKKWNDSSLGDFAILPENATSRRWPMFGMLAIGLVLGTAIGAFAASQRWQMERLARHANRMGDELAGMDKDEEPKPLAGVTYPRSNHRRKTTAEV